METASRFALKEWAVVERALLEGRQNLLLRKGGLIEGPEGFKAEHSSFFIYPTFLHQQRLGIKKEFLESWEEIPNRSSSTRTVRLSLMIEVLEAFHVDRLDHISEINNHHIFHEKEIEKRFNYGKVQGLNIMMVRVYQLIAPVVIPFLPHFAGCRSWVDLGRLVSSGEIMPVQSDMPKLLNIKLKQTS